MRPYCGTAHYASGGVGSAAEGDSDRRYMDVFRVFQDVHQKYLSGRGYRISCASRYEKGKRETARQGYGLGPNPLYQRDLGIGVCQWFTTIGGLGRPILRLIEPRPVGCGRRTSGYWQNEKQRELTPGVAPLVPRQ